MSERIEKLMVWITIIAGHAHANKEGQEIDIINRDAILAILSEFDKPVGEEKDERIEIVRAIMEKYRRRDGENYVVAHYKCERCKGKQFGHDKFSPTTCISCVAEMMIIVLDDYTTLSTRLKELEGDLKSLSASSDADCWLITEYKEGGKVLTAKNDSLTAEVETQKAEVELLKWAIRPVIKFLVRVEAMDHSEKSQDFIEHDGVHFMMLSPIRARELREPLSLALAPASPQGEETKSQQPDEKGGQR